MGSEDASPTKRLLVVDDEETLRFALKRYFTRIGCRVSTAREREEAEALLSHEVFDLVILDLALTSYGIEGLDILREIRYRRASTPVLILSAFVTPDIEKDAIRRGASAILIKPQPLSELARVAVRLMESAP